MFLMIIIFDKNNLSKYKILFSNKGKSIPTNLGIMKAPNS